MYRRTQRIVFESESYSFQGRSNGERKILRRLKPFTQMSVSTHTRMEAAYNANIDFNRAIFTGNYSSKIGSQIYLYPNCNQSQIWQKVYIQLVGRNVNRLTQIMPLRM